jgi:hypothetical protein
MFAFVMSIGCTVGAVLGWDLPLASWVGSYRAFTNSAVCPAQMDWVAYYRRQSAVTAQQWPSCVWHLPSSVGFDPTIQWAIPNGWTICPPPPWGSPTMQWPIPNGGAICPPGPQGAPEKPSAGAR